jgi:hypothetical protein
MRVTIRRNQNVNSKHNADTHSPRSLRNFVDAAAVCVDNANDDVLVWIRARRRRRSAREAANIMIDIAAIIVVVLKRRSNTGRFALRFRLLVHTFNSNLTVSTRTEQAMNSRCILCLLEKVGL